MKKLILVCFSIVCCVPVWASPDQTIHYEASYLGIPVLDMTLTWAETDSSIAIQYDNQLKPLIAYFHPIHNIYRVEFLKQSFHPLNWSKSISEGKMQFNLSATLASDSRMAYFSNLQQRSFPEHALTVFSATHYLASKANDAEFFPRRLEVFVDGEIWEAAVTRYSARHPHPHFHCGENQILIQADLHYLRGSRVMQENDVLMSVIASEGTRFMLWVEPDGIYSKAQFGEFPKAVVLEKLDD